ncbi:LysR family transcriptional regulator [Rhizobium sp. AU243]|uniref:LysR family transcriptional regulator n=1 Tax=Rhizobium sp. AU243 TaxID=2303425 RepID=UPI0010CAFCFC|nr:LysR family transcriptional regulator [Rhizobium sp. AU243]TKV70451.1 LysR family transcriptional regulator [Rhizobium sp. AU243]
MQAIDWNDLKYILALARYGSYAAAARYLKVDPTTVSRRLRAIEGALEVRFFERGINGEMSPTRAGETAAQRAETVETEILGLAAAANTMDSSVSGTVRVTAVPILINRVLMPAAGELVKRHPQLRLELIAEPRDLSLTRREADIALRLARPGETTGNLILARRIGMLAYAPYAANDSKVDPNSLPWLTYEAGMNHLPQAEWIAEVAQSENDVAPIVANDAEAILQGILAGLGRSLLPCIVADQMSSLMRLVTAVPPPEREMWLLTHPDLRHLARISVVLAWIDEVVSRLIAAALRSAPASGAEAAAR